ncbi:hypothetical protein, partial [Variovorax paradoxus]|uniref:hypothetical protein n=1 Tax=Variovorax paradoxus TaxID=34073 RepID=UPI001ABC1D20
MNKRQAALASSRPSFSHPSSSRPRRHAHQRQFFRDPRQRNLGGHLAPHEHRRPVGDGVSR